MFIHHMDTEGKYRFVQRLTIITLMSSINKTSEVLVKIVCLRHDGVEGMLEGMLSVPLLSRTNAFIARIVWTCVVMGYEW
jgi:hypothetical protein